MQQVSSSMRRTRRRPGLRRLLQNLGRLPRATAASLYRWLDPGFWLEREARNVVGGWLSCERRRQLERIPGRLSARQGMLLAYLAAKAPAGGDLVHVGAWESQATAWLTEGVLKRSDRPCIVSVGAYGGDFGQEASDTVRRFDSQAHRLKIYRTRIQDISQSFGRPIALLWMDICRSRLDIRRTIEWFLPAVTCGGWAVCVVPDAPATAEVRAVIGKRVKRGARFRRIATTGQLEIFRRET
jgi:hypothetical protein